MKLARHEVPQEDHPSPATTTPSHASLNQHLCRMWQGLTSRMTAVVSRRGALRGSANALSYPSSAAALRCRASSTASADKQETYERSPGSDVGIAWWTPDE